MAEINVENIWNSVRDKDAGDAEYALADPEFKAKLGHAAGEAQQGRSTGIAGLEKFEEAVAKKLGETLSQSGVDAGRVEGSTQASVTDGSAQPAGGTEKGVTRTPKGSGAQKGAKVSQKSKALKDAAAAKSRVEASPENSPDAPSAARPMAAESPANTATSKSSKKPAAKSSSKSSKKASK